MRHEHTAGNCVLVRSCSDSRSDMYHDHTTYEQAAELQAVLVVSFTQRQHHTQCKPRHLHVDGDQPRQNRCRFKRRTICTARVCLRVVLSYVVDGITVLRVYPLAEQSRSLSLVQICHTDTLTRQPVGFIRLGQHYNNIPPTTRLHVT